MPIRYHLVARISSADLPAVRPTIPTVLPGLSVREDGPDLVVEGDVVGTSAKELNRSVLSALRRVEKRTRLRAEWTAEDGVTERYFDYVLKSKRGP